MKFFKYKEITHATLEISKIYLNQTPAITFFFFLTTPIKLVLFDG